VTDEDTPIIIDFMANDYDVDDDFALQYVAWNPTEIHGELELVHNYEVEPGVFRHVLRYTPDPNWFGSASAISYGIQDSFDAQASAQILITVNPVNDPPVAVDDYIVMDEDTSVIIDFMANDYDIDDDFDWYMVAWNNFDLHGEANVVVDYEVEPGVFRTVVVYTPDPNWHGSTSTIHYEIWDSSGAVSSTAYIHITVNSVNDAPVAVDDYVATDEDTPIIIDFLGNDYDVDDTFTLQYVAWNSDEIHGELELVSNYEVEPGVFRTVLRYTPEPDWYGSSSSISYGIQDSERCTSGSG
jgi:hypothetical protein